MTCLITYRLYRTFFLLSVFIWLTTTACQPTESAPLNPTLDPEPNSITATLTAPAQPLLPETPTVLNRVQTRGYLKVGVRVWPDGTLNPPLYRSAFGPLTGFEVDIAWTIANNLGVELEMTETDPSYLLSGEWHEEFDLVLGWLPMTDNARQTLLFSSPYAYDVGAVAVRVDEPDITTWNALAERRLAVPSFSLYQRVAQGQFPAFQGDYLGPPPPANLTVRPYLDDRLALQDLAGSPNADERPIDAFFHTRTVLNGAIATDWPLKVVEDQLFIVPIGVGFSRLGLPSEQLQAEVNRILQNMHHSSALGQLSLEWYSYDITTPESALTGGE